MSTRESVRHQGLMVLVLAASASCGGAPNATSSSSHPSGPGPTVRIAPAVAKPISPPAPSASASAWFHRRIDPTMATADFDSNPTFISVGNGRIVLVAKPQDLHPHSTTFVLGEHESDPSDSPMVRVVAAAFPPTSPRPWLLGIDGGLIAFLPDGTTETVVPAPVEIDDGDLVVDSAGNAHACIVNRSLRSAETGEALLLTRTQRAKETKRAWAMEKIADKASGCRLAVQGDRTTVLVGGDENVTIRTRRAGESWAVEELPNTTHTEEIALGSSASGAIVVATGTSRNVSLWKLDGARWAERRIEFKEQAHLQSLRATVDNSGTAHAVWVEGWEVRYVSDQLKDPITVSQFGQSASLDVDASGGVHIAYLGDTGDPNLRSLIYARPVSSGDLPVDADGYAVRDDLVRACSELIQADHGRAISESRRLRGIRWCQRWDAADFPTIVDLYKSCTEKHEVNACVVGAELSASLKELRELHRTTVPCTDKASRTCDLSEAIEGAQYAWPRQNYSKIAEEQRVHACELGADSECVQIAYSNNDASALQQLCKSKQNLLACAAAAEGAQIPKDVAVAARESATNACKVGTAQGCNLLAYLEDVGVGGRRDAASAFRHHTQACFSGASTMSCISVLRSAKPPRPPQDFDAAQVHEHLDAHCSANEKSACETLARMTKLGWLHK